MKTQNTIIGRASGKLGNTVASTQFRRNVIRSKAINPKTGQATNQIKQRLYMKALIPVIRLMKVWLMFVSSKDIGFMSRFNSVMKNALVNAVSEALGVVTIDFTKIKIGSGTYYPLLNLTLIQPTAGDPIQLSYEKVLGGYAGADTDLVSGFIYNKTKNKIYPLETADISTELVSTGAVDTSTNDVLYAYVYNYPAGYDPLGPAAFKPARTFINEVKTKTVSA